MPDHTESERIKNKFRSDKRKPRAARKASKTRKTRRKK